MLGRKSIPFTLAALLAITPLIIYIPPAHGPSFLFGQRLSFARTCDERDSSSAGWRQLVTVYRIPYLCSYQLKSFAVVAYYFIILYRFPIPFRIGNVTVVVVYTCIYIPETITTEIALTSYENCTNYTLYTFLPFAPVYIAHVHSCIEDRRVRLMLRPINRTSLKCNNRSNIIGRLGRDTAATAIPVFPIATVQLFSNH